MACRRGVVDDVVGGVGELASVFDSGESVKYVKSAPIARCNICPIIAVWLSKRRSVRASVDVTIR